MDMVELGPEYDYDATIVLTPGFCTLDGAQHLSAQWDYFGIGEVCTSELDFVGVGIGPDGARTYTFYDHSRTGPCRDGLVELSETADPLVMVHTWRALSGTNIVSEGELTVTGLCTPGFVSEDDGGDGGD